MTSRVAWIGITLRPMGIGVLRRAFAFGLAFLACAVLCGGCTPVHDKAHDLSNAFSGNYDATVNASPEEVAAATRATVQDLQLHLISERKGSDAATQIVIARSPEDEKVTVTINPPAADGTRYTVTTGVFGNSTLRQEVMDGIKLRLGRAKVQPLTTASAPTTRP